MQRTPVGRTVLAEGYPVLAESGDIERVVSVSYDLTDLERLRAEYQHLQSDLMESSASEPTDLSVESRRIHFESPAARAIYRLIRRVAKTDANVLILGETGVGKTLFAHELHDLSDRCGGPLVELNCAALPEHLFEAELFGYESGAFTAARRTRATRAQKCFKTQKEGRIPPTRSRDFSASVSQQSCEN
jgi:transcriptional regulator with PAS, ATPase and Fis domain